MEQSGTWTGPLTEVLESVQRGLLAEVHEAVLAGLPGVVAGGAGGLGLPGLGRGLGEVHPPPHEGHGEGPFDKGTAAYSATIPTRWGPPAAWKIGGPAGPLIVYEFLALSHLVAILNCLKLKSGFSIVENLRQTTAN